MCFVWIWEQTAIISLYNINWLVFITETESVYCAVRTGYLNTTDVNFNSRGLIHSRTNRIQQAILIHNNSQSCFAHLALKWLRTGPDGRLLLIQDQNFRLYMRCRIYWTAEQCQLMLAGCWTSLTGRRMLHFIQCIQQLSRIRSTQIIAIKTKK